MKALGALIDGMRHQKGKETFYYKNNVNGVVLKMKRSSDAIFHHLISNVSTDKLSASGYREYLPLIQHLLKVPCSDRKNTYSQMDIAKIVIIAYV